MATTYIATVDARILPTPKKHPTIFRTFEGLPLGQAMLLVNDHDPKPLHYQFAAERPGQFEWRYLENGPEVWRVEIRRTGTSLTSEKLLEKRQLLPVRDYLQGQARFRAITDELVADTQAQIDAKWAAYYRAAE